MEKINKYLPLLSFVGVVGSIVAGVYFFGGFMKQMETGIFTPEEKVQTLNHVESAPNEVDNYIAYQRLDSISKIAEQMQLDNKENKEDAMRSRAVRDSIFTLQSITIYQNKETNELILKKLDSMNKHHN